MTVTNTTGLSGKAVTRSGALPAEVPAPPPADSPPADTLAIQATAADGRKARVLEGRVSFGTGKATPGTAGQPDLDRTLDAVVATLKTLSPEQQSALLADPGFMIEIEGRASNLGGDRNFDNLGLSRKRARNTGEYVKAYLKQRGIDVPDSRIKATGAGSPGNAKPPDDDDPADRTARVRFVLPGLSPLPPAPPSPLPEVPPEVPPDPPPAPEPSPADAALARFNEATAPLEGMLARGGAAETTLADREATVAQVREALSSAGALVGKLPPVAQPGAQALVHGLQESLDRLAERATREREAATKLQAQFKTDAEALAKAEQAKNKRGLRELVVKLLATYGGPEAVGKDLPPDVRQDAVKQAGELRRTIHEAIARHSDDHKFDEPDNSYMFGRPGPKFKKAWEALKGILAGGPPTPEQRSQAVRYLKDMDDAVGDFDDPLVKEAARFIYDDLTRAVSAKLSG